MNAPTIGARMKAARAQLNITQSELAKKLGFRDATQISSWETGKREPSAANLRDLDLHLFAKMVKLNFEAEKVAKKTTEKVEKKDAPAATFSLSTLPTMELVKTLREVEGATGTRVLARFLKAAMVAGLTLPDLIEMVRVEE